REIDWICVSPKGGNKIIQTSGEELKLVYPQIGVKPSTFEKYAFKNFSLQPMDGELKVHNTNLTLKYCMKNPIWRVSIQTHKIIGIR
ncbi:MAG: 7-carboxy-7-deazaguanine synthase, partial [Pelagibacterales bacterium]|nr:7-carboxy-7-deazaguanine synthase [Pelagibacterales bacterium]